MSSGVGGNHATFIRRASLDICGTLPTANEVTAYLNDTRLDKRRRLIDQLLSRPEYATYFALKWADSLQNRGRGYSTGRQRSGTTLFSAWNSRDRCSLLIFGVVLLLYHRSTLLGGRNGDMRRSTFYGRSVDKW